MAGDLAKPTSFRLEQEIIALNPEWARAALPREDT